MILLPIGHEEGKTRRLPWVTFTIMGICVLAFVASGRGGLVAEDDSRIEETFYEAYEYWTEHPYLEIDGEFEEWVRADFEDDSADAAMSAFESLGGEPPPEFERVGEQATLDSMIARWLDAQDEHPLTRWGLVPDSISPVGVLTHMFLHVGWLHLIGNMLILYLAGPFIEDVWGRPAFVAFYLVSGVVAGLSHAGLHLDSAVPLIGASGAIAGVMGAFLVRYRHTKIRFFYLLGLFVRGTFSAPAWLMLPLWLVQQVFFGLLTRDLGDGAGVAYWAHVGGFVFGAGVAVAMVAWQVEERFLHEKLEAKSVTEVVNNSTIEDALAAKEQGDPEGAFVLLADEAGRAPSNPDVALAFWSVAVELDRGSEAAPMLARCIETELREGALEAAVDHWDELGQHAADAAVGPAMLLRLARLFDRQRRPDEARGALRRALLEGGAELAPTLALNIATAALKLDPRVARGAVRIALARSDLAPEDREAAEGLLAELDGVALAPSAPLAT